MSCFLKAKSCSIDEQDSWDDTLSSFLSSQVLNKNRWLSSFHGLFILSIVTCYSWDPSSVCVDRLSISSGSDKTNDSLREDIIENNNTFGKYSETKHLSVHHDQRYCYDGHDWRTRQYKCTLNVSDDDKWTEFDWGSCNKNEHNPELVTPFVTKKQQSHVKM